jgi:hypothetical protein
MAEIIVSGRILELLYTIIFIAISWYHINRTKTGWLPYFRTIPALDAIDEIVGRAVEMGRPITVGPGVSTQIDDQTLVGLEIIRYTAQQAAEKGAEIIATTLSSTQFPLIQEMVRTAFLEAGVPEAYKPENVRYIASNSLAYATGVQTIVERENCVANINVGQTGGAIMLLFARSKTVLGDVINLGGTSKVLNTPHLIIVCHYVIIGEEMYAVSAYLQREPDQMAVVRVTDIFKAGILAIILAGLVLTLIGSADFLINLLSL